MHERTVKLTRESIDLREKLKKSEQIQASMMEDAKRSRESLKLAELNVMTQPARPYVPATAPAVEPATSDRRGGFTDFGDSVTQAPPISQAPTGRSSTVADTNTPCMPLHADSSATRSSRAR